MVKKYLNDTGLAYLWQKIKNLLSSYATINYVDNKFDSIVNGDEVDY